MSSPLPLLAILGAGLAFAITRDSEVQKKPKPKPRPGQPTPGATSPVPGIPSIPSVPPVPGTPVAPPAVIARMVAALATKDVREIRRVANALEKEGHLVPASELRAAADALEISLQTTSTAPPVIPVAVPPPGAVPVTPPVVQPSKPPVPVKPPVVVKPPAGPPPFVPPEVSPLPGGGILTSLPASLPASLPSLTNVIPVAVPPPGAVPIAAVAPSPPPHPVGAIPDQSTLVGKTALMLWESGAGPVRDVPLLQKYKKSVGLKDTSLYGPGTAKSLMMREIVPPTPWDWPRNKRKAAKSLSNNYKFKASKDRARQEEWLQAADALKGFL